MEKTTTYGDLKIRKAELRNEMRNGDFSNCDEYGETLQAIKNAELMLLWSITPDEAYGELEKPKKRIKVTIAIGITIAALALVLLLSGCNVARESCHLIGAACQDVGWTATKLGENITVEEER